MNKSFVRLFRCFSFFVFLLIGQNAFCEGVVNSTHNIIQDNINAVKTSAKDLYDTAKDLIDMVNDDIENLDEVWSGDSDEKKQMLSSVTKQFKSLMSCDQASLQNFNLDGLKDMVGDLLKDVNPNSDNKFVNKLKEVQDKTSTLVQKAMGVINLAYTTPIGFRSDQLNLTLSVDTLRYVRNGDTDGSIGFSAHADWILPWTVTSDDAPTNVRFAGDIVLKGSGESKLKLQNASGSDYLVIPLSKNKVYLALHKNTYVTYDCSGFKEMWLEGEVRFASDLMYKAEIKGPKDSLVSAHFGLFVYEMDDLLFEASIKDRFKLKITDDVIYRAEGLVADFSTKRNGTDFQTPKGYLSPFKSEDASYWTGFFIKQFSVDLTEQFPDLPLDSASANNMLIDETGVSGYFTVAASTKSSKKPEKNSSVEATFKEVSIGIQSGKITAGALTGNVKIKPLKDERDSCLSLDITGGISRADSARHLNFEIETKLAKEMVYKLPFIKTTTVTIGRGTGVSFTRTWDSTEAKFNKRFLFTMNGGIDVDNKLVKIKGLKFEGMEISSTSPHFSPGKFSLSGIDSPALHGLPFGLKEFGSKKSKINLQGIEEAILSPKIYLQIIGKESEGDDKQGCSVEAGFDLVSNIDEAAKISDWKITGLRLNSIKVDVNYSAFHLGGQIEGYHDDEMYGDGFHGALSFSMKTPNIGADAEAYFGKTSYMPDGTTSASPYKYWYVYANVDVPTTPPIVLFPPAVYLKNVSLAVYSKVGYVFDEDNCKVTKVYPDKSNKFGLKAGIGFFAAQEKLVNAQVKMGIDFSSSGGVSLISLNGIVGVLGKDKNNSFLKGKVSCKYDFENSILSFDASVKPGSAIDKIVKGEAWLKMRAYPDSWYVQSGTVKNPIDLKFVGIVSAKSYLMFGDSLPSSLPPLDPRITDMFNVTQSTATTADHSAEFSDGRGFAFGSALSFECHLSAFVYADLVFLGGVDVLVVKIKEDCEGSNFRASGQVYVYLEAGAGIKVRKKKFEIVEFAAAADLRGEVPKPVYVHGNIAFKYRVLGGLIKGHAHANYKTGSSCKVDRDYSEGIFNGVVTNEEEDQKATDANGQEVDMSDN